MNPEGYQCGDFHLDVANRRFSHGEEEIALEPKTFAVLVHLVTRAGDLVTRHELLDAVWGHRHITPSALNRRIALARRALRDEADQPTHIQTIHGAGYRYIGPVRRHDRSPAADTLRFGPPLTARLPARTEALIGREQELAALAGLFRSHRAVTIVGTGGMGKTQCALECARRLCDHYPDGVWFFDLAPMQHGAQWLRALAAALEIPPSEPAELLRKLLSVLQDRRALLLIDNCDRIAAEVGALVVELLRGTDTLAVLATSQKPLNFAGEQLEWLPALGLPAHTPGTAAPTLAEIEGAPAVQMLLTRIRAVQPHFVLTAATAPTMLQICRRLDGMPLALELAAVRFALLSPEQVQQGLDHRFRFLSADTAGRDPRHRNLVAMLDWSFSLLSSEEQQLLQWLSVFVQGWTMEAATHLAAALGHDPQTAIEMMGGLVGKSLVSIASGLPQPRYQLLETVREYALLRLRASGQELRARDAHLAYVVDLSGQSAQQMIAGHMRELVGKLAYEHGNIGSAVDHAAGSDANRRAGLTIVGSLTLYIKARGPLDIGQQWCRRALAGSAALEAPERGRALLCQGILAAHLRDQRESPEGCLLEAAAVARAHADSWTEAYARGYCAMWQANAGRIEDASAALRVTQCIAEQTDDPLLRGLAGLARGWIHLAQNDSAAAVETLWAVRDLGGDHHQRHFIRVYLGLALVGLGRHRAAARVLSEAMGMAIELGNVRGAAACVECCGWLCEKLGHERDAARLLAAARLIRKRTEVPLFNFWLPLHDAVQARLQARLGARELESCSRAGAALREEDAINEAYSRLRSFGSGLGSSVEAAALAD